MHEERLDTRTAAFRRTVGAICLGLAPVLFTIGKFATPDTRGGSASDMLTAFTGHQNLMTAVVLTRAAMAMTMIVGVFALVDVIRARGAALAHVSLAMVLYGVLTVYGLLNALDLVTAVAANNGLDRPAMLALFDKLHKSPAGAPLLLGHVLFALGILLLGVAVLRAHVGPRWAGWFVVAFPLTDVALSPVRLLDLAASDALGIVGFAALALTLLRMSDAEWTGSASLPSAAPALV